MVNKNKNVGLNKNLKLVENNINKTESVKEFLARGGVIRKIAPHKRRESRTPVFCKVSFKMAA